MAWIESHQEIAQHPKTRRLARYLGVSVPDAIGRLHLLWWWAMNYAEDGDLSAFDADDLADATMWEGDPAALLDALKRAGFIDDGGHIHDWDEYAGRLIEKRRQDADRKRQARTPSIEKSGRTTERPADVRRTAHVTVPNPTVPDSTGPPTPIPVSADGGSGGKVAAFATKDQQVSAPQIALTDGARETVEVWRIAQGKARPPRLNPAQVAKLEKAVIEVGLEWLRFGAKWSAERGLPEFDKAINAAYTARQNAENGSNGHGENRQRPGGIGQGPRRANAGAGGGAAGEDDPFAKYVRSDEHPNGLAGSP